jgi:hypothetical protein
MSEPTVERFREIYPEFDETNFPNARVEYALELAQEVHSCSKNAIYALMAHFLSLSKAESTGVSGGEASTATIGTIKKTSIGRLSTEFITMSQKGDDAYYEQTPYGKTYLMLRNSAARRFNTRVW